MPVDWYHRITENRLFKGLYYIHRMADNHPSGNIDSTRVGDKGQENGLKTQE